jgi:hypothetical protein
VTWKTHVEDDLGRSQLVNGDHVRVSRRGELAAHPRDASVCRPSLVSAGCWQVLACCSLGDARGCLAGQLSGLAWRMRGCGQVARGRPRTRRRTRSLDGLGGDAAAPPRRANRTTLGSARQLCLQVPEEYELPKINFGWPVA